MTRILGKNMHVTVDNKQIQQTRNSRFLIIAKVLPAPLI
jgi:hypothetical protein